MPGLSVTIVGQDEAIAAVRMLDLAAQRRIKDVVNETALNIQREAKKRCPVNFGRLRNAIRPVFFKDGLAADIGPVDVDYASYVEFGTGPAAGHARYMPPPGVLALWMKRKGIPAEAENAIRLAIWRNGTKPQPFMFPAWEEERPAYLDRLADALGNLGEDVGR